MDVPLFSSFSAEMLQMNNSAAMVNTQLIPHGCPLRL